MSDNLHSPEQDSKIERQGGERLAAARRARDISLREVAKELHLDEPKVLALEENRFEDLGAPVFAKGHMRKYAELVGVSIDDILADYYRMNRSVGAPPVIGLKRAPRREISPGPWIAAVAVIAVGAAAGWWWYASGNGVVAQPEPADTLAPFASDDNAGVPDSVQTPNDQAAVPDTAVEITPQVVEEAAGAPAANESAAATDVTTVPVELIPVTNEPIGAADNTIQLRLSFSGDCWTEVTDAVGRRLYFDLGAAGRTVTLSGSAPLRVLLGNSENVVVEVDGAAYPIAAADRRGNTARLSINSQ